MERIVIGLTGPTGSGKGDAAKHLVSKGFIYISLSDILREISGSNDTKILLSLGNRLREAEGPGVLAKLAGDDIRKSTSRFFVVDSIRHPEEIKHLWSMFDANIIGFNASLKTLSERVIGRKRQGDAKDYDEFMLKMERENGKDGSNSPQVMNCLKMANPIIINEGTFDELFDQVDLALLKYGIEAPKVNKERG